MTVMTLKEELKWILNHLNVDELDNEQANALISVISSFKDSVIPTKEELKAMDKYEKGEIWNLLILNHLQMKWTLNFKI